MEGVIILHETIHELHRKKMNGLIFKIGFEMQMIIWGGHVGIKINDQVGPNFQTKKGLRQGDPLSPLLFNIVVDMLVILIKRTKAEGQINGVVPHLVEDGLSILQYVDDTLIFLDHDIEKAKKLLLLCAFEKLSGLKINFHKSEIFCFGQAKEMQE
jgi:hypothetical protein